MSRQGYNIRSKHPNSDAMQTTYQDEDDAVLYSRWPALRLPPTGEDPIFGNVSLELDQEALGLEFLKGDALEEQRMSFERALFENAAVLCDL